LPVWQTAIELAVRAYDLTATPEFSKRYSLRDQIVRATVSVSNNIAEGFDRGTNPDLINLIYIARGPVGEVRYVICMLDRMPAFQSVNAGIRNLMQQTESIYNQIGAWIEWLLNSGMKGQRYVTEKVRLVDQRKVEREEFLKKLERMRNGENSAWR
jgi:four helix bundle protein